MTTVLLSLLHLFLPLDFEQVEQDIRSQASYAKLITYLETNAYQDSENNKYHIDYEREIGNNTQQIEMAFTTEEFGMYFHLNLIKHNDTLLYFELSQDKKLSRNIINPNALQQYLDYINPILKTSKTTKDFKREIETAFMFSESCGFSGEPSKLWKKMEKYVNKKSIKPLQKMLTSLDVEVQAYGAIGLLRLQSKGIALRSQDLAIIEYLKQRNSEVYTCSGCSLGVLQETKVLVEAWGK